METAYGPYALLVKRQTFLPYSLPKKTAEQEAKYVINNNNLFNCVDLIDCSLTLTREDALQYIGNHFHQRDVIVGTTGMLSRELFEFRAGRGDGHERDFLTVGGMGHASSIALGIALQKSNRTVSIARMNNNKTESYQLKLCRFESFRYSVWTVMVLF